MKQFKIRASWMRNGNGSVWTALKGQEKPIELVRGLENSRTISGLARPCMQYMHGLASPEISPGVLKTSNQLYRVAMAPRNVPAPLKVHVRKLVQ